MFEQIKPTKRALKLFEEGKLGQIRIKGQMYVPRCTMEMRHRDGVTLVKIKNENGKVIAKTIDRRWPLVWCPDVTIEIAFEIYLTVL